MKVSFARDEVRVRVGVDEARSIAEGSSSSLDLSPDSSGRWTFELRAGAERWATDGDRTVASVPRASLEEAIEQHPSTDPVATGMLGGRRWVIEIDTHSRRGR